jgi:hypothetical protein
MSNPKVQMLNKIQNPNVQIATGEQASRLNHAQPGLPRSDKPELAMTCGMFKSKIQMPEAS